jgi:hypothetical protein
MPLTPFTSPIPQAMGTQWGDGDNGADLRHLYAVIDWIYATFGNEFNVRTMWSQGGSDRLSCIVGQRELQLGNGTDARPTRDGC